MQLPLQGLEPSHYIAVVCVRLDATAETTPALLVLTFNA